MRTSTIAPFAVSAALAALAAWTASARNCGMAFVDTSVPTQSVAACSCEGFFTVDFSVAVTCCECYSGPFAFSGVYRRGTDGSIPPSVSTNFVAACDCDGCNAEHRVSCSVALVADPFCGDEPSPPGSPGGGSSRGGTGGLPLPLRASRRTAPPGPACAVPRGAPTVAISLGRSRSGGFTGHLELDPARVFSLSNAMPDAVIVHGNSRTGLDIVRSAAGGLRQVRSAGCLAEFTVPPASNSFAISFYHPSDLESELTDDGLYAVLPGAVPFAVYEVGPFADESGRRVLPVVERRGGETVSSRALYASRSSPDAGLSLADGLVERGVRELADGALLRYVRGAGAPERGVVDRYAAVGGEQVLAMRVEASSSGEARTSRWEYAEGPYPAAHVDPSGLRTEYAYDGAGRVVRETVRAPGRPARVRTMSYDPVGVRPPSAGVMEDDGSQGVEIPRVEDESVDGVPVSRTVRFVAIDARNHRIVEETRLRDPSMAPTNGWRDALSPHTFRDYMPKSDCRPCSERIAREVHADGTEDESGFASGEYVPGPGGSAGVFTPVPGGDWFRTVTTHRPPQAASSRASAAQVPGRTTRDVTVELRSSKRVVLRETHVCTGPGENDFERVAWTATTRDHLGNPVLEVSSDGSRVEREYAGERLLAETAADGSRTTYSYDALGRVVSETKSWNGLRPAVTTSYVRDPEGRVLSRTVASGGLFETETTEYDAFGRTTLAVAADGVATKYLYETDAVSGLETRTAIRGYGTPCAVTNETVSYADGRMKETRLNGVLRRTYSYGVDADGCEWTKTSEGRLGPDSPRWRTAKTDPLGRTVEETTPGFGAAIVSSNRYDAAGRLVATSTYASPTPASILRSSVPLCDATMLRSAIYLYDSLGERTATVEDIDFDGVVDLVGPDRVVSNSTQYVKLGSDWWRESSTWQARISGSPAPTRVSCARERMTGLGGADGLVSETVSMDIRGNETRAFACRDRAAMAETRIVSVPGSEIPETSVSVCGLVVTNVTSTGVATTYGYDALGRETSATDGRGNTTTTAYDQYGRVVSTTDGAGNATTYGYDAIGRRVSATDPMGNTVTTAYDAEGRVVSRRGATYPVDYAYDDYGGKISMTTYRSESLSNGDVTRWLRDEATGLVTNKVYADGKGPSYSYTPDGRLATRTWARGVVTAYAYDSSGALTNTVYSDGTPTVSMAYDRTGNLVSAITAGVCTNLYAYDTTGLCTNEVQNGVAIARSYDALGRQTGYAVDGQAVSYGYDPATGRLISAASGTNEFFYTYLPGTDLVAGYVSGDFSHAVSYEISRDLVSAVTNRFGSRVISAFGYSNDAAGRRTAISRSGEAFGDLSGSTDSYGYNLRSEVVSARRTKGGASVRGFDEDFSYDPIGNRVATTNYDETGSAIVSEYAANSLNQYTSRTVPGVAAARGFADANATVTVNENPTWRLGEYFFGSDEFDNSQSAVDAALVTTAALASPTNGPDEVASVTSRVHIAKTPQLFEYDLDGNQTLVTTKTGTWRVTYNGENRPVLWERVAADSNTLTSNTQTRVSMSFDHQGRRRMYLEAAADGSTNHIDHFSYDNYLCVARNRWQPGGTIATDRFVWDPTEPVATRPLAFYQPNAQPQLYSIDGNKNVSELVSSDDGTISAHYEYAPFGEVILSSGDLAFTNPFHFSSEYADDTLGLVCYNCRHYNPVDGRWIGRDPAEDNSTFQVYQFCRNLPIVFYDYLGCSYYVSPGPPPGGWNAPPNVVISPPPPLPNCSSESSELQKDRDELESRLAATCPEGNEPKKTPWRSSCCKESCLKQAKAIADAVLQCVQGTVVEGEPGGWLGNALSWNDTANGCNDWSLVLERAVDTALVESQVLVRNRCFDGHIDWEFRLVTIIPLPHKFVVITSSDGTRINVDPWPSGGRRLFP